MHAVRTEGYGAAMTESPGAPLSAPVEVDGQPEPAEPSATNPDADGVDEEPS
jgi:hypothetical protein